MNTNEVLERVVDIFMGYAYADEIDEASIAASASDILYLIEDHYGLTYSNPGEPQVSNGDVTIPLTSCNAGNNGSMLTSEEEELGVELSGDIYWARLRLRQARDILEGGWQYGLKEEKSTSSNTQE